MELDCHSRAGQAVKQQAYSPRSAVVTSEVSQSGNANPLSGLPASLLHSPSSSSPGAGAPPRARRRGRGWRGARQSCRWRGEPGRAHGTRPLPRRPAPAARLRLGAPGLDAQAGVFWEMDAFGPDSRLTALTSFATTLTPSSGPLASSPGVGMLAFLPVTLECFPIMCPCLTGSLSPLSL